MNEKQHEFISPEWSNPLTEEEREHLEQFDPPEPLEQQVDDSSNSGDSSE